MIDAEIADLDRQLGELAAHDLASAPAGLETRVTAAALGALPPRAPARSDSYHLAPRAAAHRLWLTPARVAATIGLAGALLATYAATRPDSINAGAQRLAAVAQDDLDVLLAVTATLDDQASDELSAIHLETTTLSDRVRGGMPMSELFDEGAM